MGWNGTTGAYDDGWDNEGAYDEQGKFTPNQEQHYYKNGKAYTAFMGSPQDIIAKDPRTAAFINPADFIQVDGKWLGPEEVKNQLNRFAGVSDSSFFGDNGLFQSFMKTVGRAYGVSGIAAAGLGAAAEAGSATAASFLPEGGYQGLYSSLAQHAAENGGSFLSGAQGVGDLAGSAADDTLGDGFDMYRDAYSAATGGEPYTGDISDLRNIATPQYAMNIPGISTAAGAAALPGVIQGAGAAASASGWNSFLQDLVKPSTLLPLVGQGIATAVGANAAGNALDAQTDAAGNAIGEARRQYDQTREDFAPYRVAGAQAIGELSAKTLGPDAPFTRPFSMADLNADPVYQTSLQFGADEGRKAIERRARAMGINNSGGTLKALTRFGTDYAGTKAGDSFNRFETARGNAYNRVAGVAGTGQTATGTVAQAGQNTANNVTQTMLGEGNARGAASIAQANAITGGINNAASYIQNQQYLDALQRRPLFAMS